MKLPLALPTILVSILALSPVSSNAAVTWAAQGLPPGLSINASTGAITGKPTQSGNFTVLVYPKIGNAAGYMNAIKITVLPAGVNLPVYYGYSRLTSDGTYLAGDSLTGSGGYIWEINRTLNIPEVTTNGIIFSEPSLPPNITRTAGTYGNNILAACGTKSLYLGMDSNNSVHCLLSSKGSSFYEVGIPDVVQTIDFPLTSISSDGFKYFYMIVKDTYNIGGSTVWQSSSQSISWKEIYTSDFVSSYGANISVAVSGNTNLLCFSDGSGFLISTNGGSTFFSDTSNSQIKSVAFGNGKFLGTGDTGTGVWSSTDGQNWAQISSIDPGKIIYSSYEKLFFSPSGGVSSDGVYWQTYQNGSFDSYYNVASSGTGLVFVGGSQLSTNNIPNNAGGTFQTSVGKATTINATH